MNDMERKKLTDYLKTAIELETEKATQENILSESVAAWDAKKPQMQKVEENVPIDLEYRIQNSMYRKADGDGFIVAYFLGGFAMLFGGILWAAADLGKGIWALIFFSGLIAIIAAIMIHKSMKEKDDARINEATKRNEEMNKRIDAKNRQASLAHQTKVTEWEKSKGTLISTICKNLDTTNSLLDRWYANDTIYPKYRNLPALTSIYEYFMTGRCDELSGPHGAYNMYEDEMRKDTVIFQLNMVIANLEQIKNSQYMLYQQVSSIQRDTQRVVQDVQMIRGYSLVTAQMTSLNAYYAALTASHTRISAACELLD